MRHSRLSLTPGARVGRPRHLVLFRHDPGTVSVLRVLHDATDLPQRLARLRNG